MRFTGFIHRLFGIELPEHYRTLVHLKRIIDLVAHNDPRKMDNFTISEDSQYIYFETRFMRDINNIRLRSIKYVTKDCIRDYTVYYWRADYKEYQEIYDRRRPRVNFVQERVMPAYETLVRNDHIKYTLLLIDYEGTLANLLFALNETLRLNGHVTLEMQDKTTEVLKHLVDDVEEIAYEFDKEAKEAKKQMNEALLKSVDNEVEFIKVAIKGEGINTLDKNTKKGVTYIE